jgi:hypothetical protein
MEGKAFIGRELAEIHIHARADTSPDSKIGTATARVSECVIHIKDVEAYAPVLKAGASSIPVSEEIFSTPEIPGLRGLQRRLRFDVRIGPIARPLISCLSSGKRVPIPGEFRGSGLRRLNRSLLNRRSLR